MFIFGKVDIIQFYIILARFYCDNLALDICGC